MDISRRSFLGWTAAGIAAPLAGFAEPAARPLRRPPVSIFSKHLQWLDYEGMAEVAAEVGFDGVDITVRPGGHVLPERVEEQLPRAVEAVRRAGLAVPSITTALDDPASPVTERVLRAASALGIGHYRMNWLSYHPELTLPESLEAHRERLRALAELNRRYGIHGAYQNHAGTQVGGPVWDVWLLLRGLDPRWMGCQYDIRHAVVEGGTSWPLGLRLLAPHIRTTDVKDFVWSRGRDGRWRIENVPLGEGMVDFPRYFELVEQLGIGGPITLFLEYPPFEGGEVPASRAELRTEAVAAMRRDLRRLRELLARAGLGE